MLKSIWTFFVLFSLLLMQISCQSLQNKTTLETSQSEQIKTTQLAPEISQAKGLALSNTLLATTEQPAKELHAPTLEEESLPNYKLTKNILFDYLLAELASQNKELPTAFDNFYSLALKIRDPRLAKSALRIALETNDDLKIYKAIQLWSELEPQTIDTLQIKAVVLLKITKDELATLSLLDLFQVVNNNEQTMARVGIILSSLNDYSRIKSILAEIHKNYPKDYYVDLYSAKFAFKFDDFILAEEFINQALSLNPKSEMAFLLKASLYKKMGLRDQELLIYEKAIDVLNDAEQSSLIRLEYIKLLLERNLRQKAIEQLEFIVKANNSDPNILVSIGMLAIDIKEYDYARRYFSMLYQLDPHKSQGAFLLAVLAYKEENNELALKWFNKVADKKYEYESLLRMAIILAEEKKYKQAIELLNNYLTTLLNSANSSGATTSENSNKQLNLLRLKADVLYQGELFDEAYKTYSQALEIKPKNTELLYSRAMVAEKLNKIDLSEKDLLSIIKEDPQNSTAFNALGFILTERTTRYDDARKYIEKALQITPNDMAVLDSMGWVLYKMGRLEESLIYLKQAYDFKQDPEIAAHYGEALWAAGQKNQAKTIWQSALINNPQHVVLKSTIDNYLNP